MLLKISAAITFKNFEKKNKNTEKYDLCPLVGVSGATVSWQWYIHCVRNI